MVKFSAHLPKVLLCMSLIKKKVVMSSKLELIEGNQITSTPASGGLALHHRNQSVVEKGNDLLCLNFGLLGLRLLQISYLDGGRGRVGRGGGRTGAAQR